MLDRGPALELLSDAFMHSLSLPEELQFFGPGSQLEFEPLVAALRRRLSRPVSDRLVLSGPGDDWELDEWPAAAWLSRWAADGIRTEVAVPQSVLTQLGAVSRNRLASWVEAGLARVFVVPDASVEGPIERRDGSGQRRGRHDRARTRAHPRLVDHRRLGARNPS